ncbi:PKD domain-containing protein [Winogradskyella forsetii]|uniref:PKD domain-containing protein n=1 Tax=Winogradskyella forsetii TaxID=2686077 RepID=UPI001E30C74F|nr:PKD domain-containing protein [Winogradskyella forsetii]
MMKNLIYITALLLTFGMVQSCSDDDFPVPPASTVPDFSFVIDNEEFAPATVTFTNNSIVPTTVGSVTYYWNFGDGQSASQENPTHFYTAPGAYSVNLVVTTSESLEINETTKTIVIKDPSATGVPIYYTDGAQVYQGLINNEAPVFTALSTIAPQSSYAMAIDKQNSKLYISDIGADKIYRSNLDGSDFEDFRVGVDQPFGIAIDEQDNQLYWTTGNGVQRANIDDSDTTQIEDFVTGQTNDPDGISVDMVNRKVYWINYSGGIWVKNIDGTGETELIPVIEGGSIKVIDDKIFYDEFVASGDIRLKSANLDGTGIATVAVNIGRVIYGIGYDANENKIYWGDRDTDVMMRADLDGSNAEAWFTATGDPRGIVIGDLE